MPDKAEASGASGYRIDGIYVSEQQYEQVDPDELRESKGDDDRNVTVAWDWRPLAPRRFEVVLEVSVEAVKQAPELARVRLLGLFEAVGHKPTIDFVEFLRFNAPAILFPFAREAISTMTGRGPNGAFHLNPINIHGLLSNSDMALTWGVRFLDDNPDVAATFGLDYRIGPAPAGTGQAKPKAKARLSRSPAAKRKN